MIDSGANLDFIARVFQLLHHQLKINDSKNQTLDFALETCDAELRKALTVKQDFYCVINMIASNLTLRRPWFHDFNPYQNWQTNNMRFLHIVQLVFFRANAD